MRRLVATGIVACLASGCATSSGRQGTKVAAIAQLAAGSLSLAVAGVSFVEDVDDCAFKPECTGERNEHTGTFAAVGAVLCASGLLTALVWAAWSGREESVRQVPTSANQREIMRDHERALALTLQARGAARGGDCATVRSLAVDVRHLYAEIYANMFLADVAISWCMGLRASPELTVPEKNRELAFTLTKNAAEAARRGDCATTIELERRVRDIDMNVYGAWFMRDEAIKGCLRHDLEIPTQ